MSTDEDLLRSQSVGLTSLAEYRKRRAEISTGSDSSKPASGTATPTERESIPQPAKKKKKLPKGKLSFGVDEEDDENLKVSKGVSKSVNAAKLKSASDDTQLGDVIGQSERRKLKANTGVLHAPKIMTKSAQDKEAKLREQLRQQYLIQRDAVKATEIAIPFSFYDGTSISGGVTRMYKGDHVWLFLDKSRKVGAELGVGGDKSKREWARVGVDDLMLVRGDLIIPHHYEFYHFLANASIGFHGRIFNYSAEPTAATPKEMLNKETAEGLSVPDKAAQASSQFQLSELEGSKDDPLLTKVVDRRWYEKNKHIYPASVWEEYDPSKDYTKGIRKDASGNSLFFT